jgi:integrase
VFASDSGKPRWAGILLTDYIKPAAAKAGIGKVGWHTFRHTYSTLLHAFGTVPVVQKELLRDADIRTTLGIYTHGVSEDKGQASSKVAQALL